jgi:hypothetical protein
LKEIKDGWDEQEVKNIEFKPNESIVSACIASLSSYPYSINFLIFCDLGEKVGAELISAEDITWGKKH